jgi:hypothetical protein
MGCGRRQRRHCGVAAQRWRARVSFFSGNGLAALDRMTMLWLLLMVMQLITAIPAT